MITEKGTLPIGVEFNGKLHRDFELRPALVKDSVEAMEDDRARKNKNYLAIAIMARQIVRLGNDKLDIPKDAITPALLMEMYDQDLAVMAEAAGRLRERMARFHGGDGGTQKTATGAPADGV